MDALWDAMRILTVCCATSFLFLCARAIFNVSSRTQRALLTSNGLSAILAGYVALARLGAPTALVDVWLILGLAITLFGTWGGWQYNYGPNRFPTPRRARPSRFVRRHPPPPPHPHNPQG
jgi:hypothetical protein